MFMREIFNDFWNIIIVAKRSQKLKSGDFVGAIQEFSQAIATNPNDSFSYCQRGYAYAKLGDPQKGNIQLQSSN